MEKKKLKRLPVGIQTYEKLVDQNCLYIDKTEYIYKMTQLSNYIFLSRPRRFGKSLLVSTLQSYFEGKRELFKGLYIDRVEETWTSYPVLRFDMSMAKHGDEERLKRSLGYMLQREEQKWDIISPKLDVNERLQDLIMTVHRKTGKKVVVLIDEYDAPLLDVMHQTDVMNELRQIMRNFYSPLKSCDPYLHFVFITGITKFSQLSIFSELNNLKNISMNKDFAAVCGISEEELVAYMSDYLDDFAQANQQTRQEALNALKKQYDGYHFTWPSPDIFNPFSLLNAFQDHELNSYWFESGTPTFLIEKLREFGMLPSDILRIEAMASEFDAPTEDMESVVPLLYQSGYVTIKDYDEAYRLYTLCIPNNEIRIGLMASLLPNYVKTKWGKGLTEIAFMNRAFCQGDLDGMLSRLQSYLLTIPQCDNTNYEGHYQQLLYVIFSLFGRYVDVEVRTATGRVDIVMSDGKTLYLFELKLNKSAEAAMNQINLKDYPARFSLCGLPIVKIGINFDTERRTIGEWQIER